MHNGTVFRNHLGDLVMKNKVIKGDKHPGTTKVESAEIQSGVNNDPVTLYVIYEAR